MGQGLGVLEMWITANPELVAMELWILIILLGKVGQAAALCPKRKWLTELLQGM